MDEAGDWEFFGVWKGGRSGRGGYIIVIINIPLKDANENLEIGP